MKSKKLWFTLILLLVAVYLLWPNPTDRAPRVSGLPVENQSKDAEPLDESKIVELLKPKKIKKADPLPTHKDAEVKKEKVPLKKSSPIRIIPEDSVEFKILNGNFAVVAGDIVIGKYTSDTNEKSGFIEPSKSKLWPSRYIPYFIEEILPNKDNIEQVISYFEENTPIRFVPYDGEPNAIVFSKWNEKHCASFLGMLAVRQSIYLSPKCGFNEILHEVMHALGFVHEQSREDRDQYIEVLWENIQPSSYNQFDIMPDAMVHNYVGSVFNFDYKSIMLYEDDSFAKQPGLKTLKTKTTEEISPTTGGLSRVDIERLEYLYGP